MPPSKHVLVSVIDSKSGEPVQGATVSVRYLHSKRGDRAVTDQTGRAVLKVNCGPSSDVLSYDVEVVNSWYDRYLGLSMDLDKLTTRSPDFIPPKPDVVMEIASRIDEKRAEAELDRRRKSDEEAAEKLFRESPDFWPEHRDEPYAFPANEVGQALLWKRWKRASKIVLGTQQDSDSIRSAIVRHMEHPQAKVGELRWISSTVVMARAGWYTSPIASAGYTYVLRKAEQGWTVVARYMYYVS